MRNFQKGEDEVKDPVGKMIPQCMKGQHSCFKSSKDEGNKEIGLTLYQCWHWVVIDVNIHRCNVDSVHRCHRCNVDSGSRCKERSVGSGIDINAWAFSCQLHSVFVATHRTPEFIDKKYVCHVPEFINEKYVCRVPKFIDERFHFGNMDALNALEINRVLVKTIAKWSPHIWKRCLFSGL